MAHIISDLKEKFNKGTIAIQLIFINVGVFIITGLVTIMMQLFNRGTDPLIGILSLPASLPRFITQPWSIITYMFMHADILHILFNMMWLYWFGMLFLGHFSSKHLRGLYLFGGICGGVLYMIAYNVFPFFASSIDNSLLMGASASVLAIVIAVTYRDPNYNIRLFLFGTLRLKYLALIFIISDMLFLTNNNAGGHIAHLGGALGGFLFAWSLKKGIDLTKWINAILDFIAGLFSGKTFKRKPKMKVHYNTAREQDYAYNAKKRISNEEIDAILDKIKKSGYASLTENEKKKLFDASQK